ncbi:uncharacterized protein LOC122502738 [Leptopilina heterotoma]|uniref:uncharacterized protein LOC122502738 n=1 Tax=Leptopilina heterotoma TaxID=63436 RepID=UPI001CA94571|nr:uncharacterized protein LOC122502738 [Leptopilina heterotoma]
MDQVNEDNGSPSMSKAEDNLSNSEGPLLKKREVFKDVNTTRDVFLSSSNRSERWRQHSYEMKNYHEDEGKGDNHCLWMFTLILGIIGFCNLLLSTTIIFVLRVSQGMEALEVIPDENIVKFYGNTDLDRVCLERGICEGYGDEPIELSGDNAGVIIDVTSRIRGKLLSNMQILPNATSVSRVQSFDIKDPITGNSYFSTNFPNFGLPDGVVRIDVKVAETRRIVAPMNESLRIKSSQQITLNGAEGATIDSKNIIWTANNDIFFESKNGDIILDSKQGLFLDVKNIPIVPIYLPNRGDINGQYKVCICMPQGKLFRVPVKSGGSARVNCAKVSISPAIDPCQ